MQETATDSRLELAASSSSKRPHGLALTRGWVQHAREEMVVNWRMAILVSLLPAVAAVASGCGDDSEDSTSRTERFCQRYCDKYTECNQVWIDTGEPTFDSVSECRSTCEQQRMDTAPAACLDCVDVPCAEQFSCYANCG